MRKNFSRLFIKRDGVAVFELLLVLPVIIMFLYFLAGIGAGWVIKQKSLTALQYYAHSGRLDDVSETEIKTNFFGDIPERWRAGMGGVEVAWKSVRDEKVSLLETFEMPKDISDSDAVNGVLEAAKKALDFVVPNSAPVEVNSIKVEFGVLDSSYTLVTEYGAVKTEDVNFARKITELIGDFLVGPFKLVVNGILSLFKD